MKYVARFDSSKIWQPEVIPVMDEYLSGKIKGDEAIHRLVWSEDKFLRSLGRVFSLLRMGYEGFSIRTIDDKEEGKELLMKFLNFLDKREDMIGTKEEKEAVIKAFYEEGA